MAMSRYRTRKTRVTQQTTVPGWIRNGEFFVKNWSTGGWNFVGYNNVAYSSLILYQSEEHCHDVLHHGPPYKEGGGLSIVKWTNGKWDSAHPGTYISPNGSYKYEGGFTCSGAAATSPWNVAFGASYGANDQYAYNIAGSKGAEGWNRARPGQPTAGLGQMLAEMRDLPRTLRGTARTFSKSWNSMRGRRGFNPKTYANEWVNQNFGWLPFISDCRKLYNTYKNLDKQLNYLKRNNGKWVKRHCTLSNTESSNIVSEYAVTSHAPVLNTYYCLGMSTADQGSTRIVSRELIHDWFEGRFRYYIPDIETPVWKTKAVAELFGLMPNAALLWELTPWSWLIDWFSNVGDILANLDNGLAENLAAAYAYSMSTREQVLDVHSTYRTHIFSFADTWSYGRIAKGRAAASPFGFALSMDELSTRQWSILGALGISRL